ncbi:MAG: aminotransferase class I/II-fold pyridoxal phosphate-dependent enzyme [Candidatus Acidiferrales bacterium]
MGAVEKLEAAFAEWLGAPGAVATGYGRGALWLALELIIGGNPSAEVLVPDFICQQVPEAVRRAGGSPVYFPVRRDLTVHEAEVEAAITGRTRAAVLVHYYGRGLHNIERLAELCRRRNIVVIEDCALALGARVNGALAGRFGDLAIFSFTKSDWCYGGGMIATAARDWLPHLRQLREGKCHPARRLALCYGLLRRADCAANTPGFSRVAGRVGAWLERGLSTFEPALRPPSREERSSGGRHAPAYSGNFFDIGRFDALMPAFAARRALRILFTLDARTARRRAAAGHFEIVIRRRLRRMSQVNPTEMTAIGSGENARLSDALLSFRNHSDAGDTGSFLLFNASDGCAFLWSDRAEAAGCTLRLAWPAYQEDLAARGGSAFPAVAVNPDRDWLRDHFLIVENPL